MRAYVLTTGLIFGLIFVAHVLRIALESPSLASDPSFLALTILVGALALWSVWLLTRPRPA